MCLANLGGFVTFTAARGGQECMAVSCKIHHFRFLLHIKYKVYSGERRIYDRSICKLACSD
jgi:hypothetical protein